MSSVSAKDIPSIAYPKTLLSIVASVGGLAIFLILASTLLVSQPIGSTVRGYFYAVDRFQDVRLNDSSLYSSDSNAHVDQAAAELNSRSSGGNENGVELSKNGFLDKGQGGVNKSSSGLVSDPGFSNSSTGENEEKGINSSALSGVSKRGEDFSGESPVMRLSNDTNVQKSSVGGASVAEAGCDLYHGKWISDSTAPLYTNNSCPVLTQMQNCQGNGRPDKGYENWRWKPAQCDLPRFDPKKFLEVMRGKTLAYIGDSVARNQMESMLCILWQVEVPKNRGNKKMQRYYFRSTSTMIVRIWSSWLVHQTSEPFDFAPAGVDKLLLDSPDERFMESIPTFDVIVLSSGHWFAKQSVYILNNEIVGGQLWWPDKSKQMKVNNVEAFRISVETILTAMVKHPNYTGVTILRSYSPDHYEGGAWNTGGSCTGKEKPATDGELVENGFTNIMHEKQVTGFNQAIKKQTNKSKLVLMDITEAFSYRVDGHPGPYRNPDPNKITKRGPDGRPPPQDCLHWCMPGPVDTWNELVFEIIRREFEVRQNNPS